MTEPCPSTQPRPVTIDGLRTHFRETYQLGDSQIDLMVNSSRASLEKILDEARQALDDADCSANMVQVGHNLKGLLLNMGAEEWATMARELEKSARAGESCDYAAVIDRFSRGLAVVLSYRTQAVGPGEGGKAERP